MEIQRYKMYPSMHYRSRGVNALKRQPYDDEGEKYWCESSDVTFLEDQIESMKNCGNCTHYPSSNPEWKVQVICADIEGDGFLKKIIKQEKKLLLLEGQKQGELKKRRKNALYTRS